MKETMSSTPTNLDAAREEKKGKEAVASGVKAMKQGSPVAPVSQVLQAERIANENGANAGKKNND